MNLKFLSQAKVLDAQNKMNAIVKILQILTQNLHQNQISKQIINFAVEMLINNP